MLGILVLGLLVGAPKDVKDPCTDCFDGRGGDYYFRASDYVDPFASSTAQSTFQTRTALACDEQKLVGKIEYSCGCVSVWLNKDGKMVKVTRGELKRALDKLHKGCAGCLVEQRMGAPSPNSFYVYGTKTPFVPPAQKE